ncbi:MAG: hypothetical protein JSS60_04825 [Verrucomicrobia bacterium]|nr:hypothetical protein [Verrucomicrobiota bacterium]
MQFRKGHPELSVLEAVDNLSHMAELDLTVPEEKIKPAELTEEQISERMHALSWHDPEYYAFNRERVKETFTTLLKYMKDLYEKDKGHLREDLTQRGIQAIMLLATEAAQKIDNFTDIFKGEKEAESVTELKEFKELQHFYLTKVVQRFQTIMESEEPWQEEWGTGEIPDTATAALRDLETVRRDKEYELFQNRKEDGTPYFNRNLLRHMQLMGQFDVLLADPTMEDPFMRIQMILDRDAHLASKEILHLAAPYIDEFYKEALKFKNIPFVASINKGLMALMLAGNNRNLMQNAVGKYALNYYTDFHYYLRQALASLEYRKFIANPPDLSEGFLHSVMNLSHVLCTSFFLKVGSRKDMVAFIHMLIEKGGRGSATQSQTASPLSLWNNLRDQDDSIRYLLKQYPNGPLMKTLKLFREDFQMKGFDPIAQLNQPSQLFTVASNEMHISCIRIPSPTSQLNTAKAEIVDEFCGFIRSLASVKRNQRHLLINLQDRTSWLDHARCTAIEEIQKNKEFKGTLMVVTLPKNTDFYMQSGAYIEWDDAQEFMKLVKEQVESGELCGFYFPPEIDQKELIKFTGEAIKTVHAVFFAGKDRLVHKNRLDFIEIFYQLLTLKVIQDFKPDTLSFTCKDAVDTGAAASAEMFAFLRMMNDPSHFTKEEKDFLLWMIYAPALAVRERAIDIHRMNRMLSALSIVNAELEAHFAETVAACGKLYTIPFFEGVKVKEVS